MLHLACNMPTPKMIQLPCTVRAVESKFALAGPTICWKGVVWPESWLLLASPGRLQPGGGGCGRGMCPLLHKVRKLSLLSGLEIIKFTRKPSFGK